LVVNINKLRLISLDTYSIIKNHTEVNSTQKQKNIQNLKIKQLHFYFFIGLFPKLTIEFCNPTNNFAFFCLFKEFKYKY